MVADHSAVAFRTRSQCRMRLLDKKHSELPKTPTRTSKKGSAQAKAGSPTTPVSKQKLLVKENAVTPIKTIGMPIRKKQQSSLKPVLHSSGDTFVNTDTDCSFESYDEVNEIRILVPAEFSLAHSICSYGFFLMPPNIWVPEERNEIGTEMAHFKRKLRYGTNGERMCDITISQPSDAFIRVTYDSLCDSETAQQEIVKQVKRMCRIDPLSPDLKNWWEIHKEAKSRKFGYLFRSPTLWEDMVKTITLCNTHWKRSCKMNELLCLKVSSFPGSFPSPRDVSKFSGDQLQDLCSLGYRGIRVFKLAEAICTGTLKLEWFEEVERTKEEVYKALLNIYGFGAFAANNVLQLIGYYQCYPYDSETSRLFAQSLNIKGKQPDVFKLAKSRYDRYNPYQFLAYWFELWKDYEKSNGKVSTKWKIDETSF